jgi:glyoxylase-like metal-dependent hydrolase (beta-lactamase superfamily II)
MTGSGTNSYLVGGTDCVVIDPGPDDPGHLARLVDLGDGRIRYVLVTHHHRDHAAGARHFAEMVRAPLLAAGFGDELVPDGVLREGDIVVLDDLKISVLATPGHASDHLCYLADRTTSSGGERWCFSGDHIIGGTSVAIAPPDGSMTAYLSSLERLIGLDPKVTGIAPGHGEVIDDAERVMEGYLSNRLRREQLILDALSNVPQPLETLVRVVYRGLDPRLERAASATLWAHLQKLGDEGRATSEDPSSMAGAWRST